MMEHFTPLNLQLPHDLKGVFYKNTVNNPALKGEVSLRSLMKKFDVNEQTAITRAKMLNLDINNI